MESKRFLERTLPVQERVALLMAEMTVKEKVAQLWGVWATDLVDGDRQFVTEKAQATIPDGVGQVSRVGALAMLPPEKTAPTANAIQKFLVEQTRLGIPATARASFAFYNTREEVDALVSGVDRVREVFS